MTAELEESTDDEAGGVRRRLVRLRHLSIGGKLSFGFGLLVALTLVVVALVYLASDRATESIERISHERAPAARTAADAHANLLRMVADVQAYLALGDESYRLDYDAAREAFETNLTELEPSVIAAEGDDGARRSLPRHRPRPAYGQWTPLPAQLFALRDDQLQREPALRILIEEANP